MSSQIAKKTTRSAVWLYGQRFVLSSVGLFVTAILARQLDPADFGLVALANVIMGFNVALGAATVGNYVIYDNADGREERVQSAFWLNMALTLAAISIFVLLIPWLTRFYEEPLLPMVLGLILIKFFFIQLRVVPDALIKRQIDFQKLVYRDTILQLVRSGIGIGMALEGYGIWSLIVPGLIIAPVEVGIVMGMARWVPVLKLHTKYWGEIFKYTGNVIGSTLVGRINTEGDTLLIGKFVGSAGLGIYNMAWNAANLINKNVVTIVSSIAMPALSAVKDQPTVLKKVYLQMLRLISIISFPALLGLFIVADDFVLTVYGPKWVDVILPMRILIIFMVRRSIGSPATVIFNVMGRPDIGFKFSLVVLPFYLASILIGSAYGIVGIAISVTVVKTLSGFVSLYLAGKLIDLPLTRVMGHLWPTMKVTLVMIVISYLAKIGIDMVTTVNWISLLTVSSIGGVVYLLLISFWAPELLEDLLLVIDNLSVSVSKKIRGFLRRPRLVRVA